MLQALLFSQHNDLVISSLNPLTYSPVYKATVAVTVKKAASTPTDAPSTSPSDTPSDAPSTNPSDTPSDAPTDTPTDAPTTLGELTEAKQIGTDKIEATFASDVPAETVITLTKDGNNIEGSDTKEGAKATFVSKSKLAVGTYTITAKLGDTTVSKDVTVEAEKVTDIKVTSTQALLEPGNKRVAYVYYDVYNQFAESMRSSTSVTWTSSIGQAKANKSTGCITITKPTGTDEFRYGDKLYLVGVDSKNGKTCQAEVPVGLERMIGDVEFAGFLNKKVDTTKIVKELPADFPKETYVLLYTTKDQDGQVIDAVPNNIGNASGAALTFTSNNPMVVDGSKIADDVVYTVDGVEYCSAKMEPGMYADKGGEVEIMVISTKSGAQKKFNFTVGAAARLQSFTLLQPTGTIADGDKGVTIPFEATDTNGNSIKNYETIVRSTNILMLNAGAGWFGIKENDDGTAWLYWDDGNGTTGDWNYGDSTAFDGVDRSVSLTATVVGGEGSNILLSVSDMRRPTTIKKVKINDDDADALVNGAKAEFSIKDNVTYLDQYGESRWNDNVNAGAFFRRAAGNDGGLANNHYYGVKVDVAESADTHLSVSKDKVYLDADKIIFEGENDGGEKGKDIKTDNIKYSVVESESKDAKASDWSEVGKALSASYAVVPVGALSGLSVKAVDRQQLVTNMSNFDNGYAITASGAAIDDPADGPLKIKNGSKAVVTGTYGAKTLTVPTKYCTVTGGVFTVNENNELTGTVPNVIRWKELYDTNSARYTRIDATRPLSVEVYKTEAKKKDDLFGTPKTNVKISDGKSVPTDIAFTQWWSGKLTSVNLQPHNTELKSDNNGLFVYEVGKLGEINKALAVTVFDQYGNPMPYGTGDGQVEVEFAVSNIDENKAEFAHLPNSFSVSKNNSFDIEITGAEIKDKFDLTATVVGASSVTTTVSVTVRADDQATMGNTWADCDKDFRKNFLKYDR